MNEMIDELEYEQQEQMEQNVSNDRVIVLNIAYYVGFLVIL